MTDKMKSFVRGLLLGLVGKSLPTPEREPVGYLYGQVAGEGETPTHTIDGVGVCGAVLPDINTVYTDELKQTYSFAMTFKFNLFDTPVHTLLLSQSEPYRGRGYIRVSGGPAKFYLFYSDSWAGPTDGKELQFNIIYDDDDAWANHDILNEDGSPYLAAADCVCIPIYE